MPRRPRLTTDKFSYLVAVTLLLYTGVAVRTVDAANPIDDPQVFVRQHYRDFFNREPDPAGLAFWTNEIVSCGNNAQCMDIKRQNASAAFFLSTEFQQTGYLVYRFYRASLGRIPRAFEGVTDTRTVGKGVVVLAPGWEQLLETNKRLFADEWVTRSTFREVYDSKTAVQYVDTLIANTGVSFNQPERDALVSGLDSGAETRATVLRKVVENNAFYNKEFRPAFVLMQYFGYLRRNPNDAPDTNMDGYNFWLNKLNLFGGDYLQSEMIKSFLVSAEYRNRFNEDTAAPLVSVKPAGGSTVSITTPLTEITVDYSDASSGVDLSTFTVAVDGSDYTRLFEIESSKASYMASLAGGSHTIEASVRDRAGNQTQTTSRFILSAFRALPEVMPGNGTLPLTVTFVTKAEYTDGTILRYRWDFQGDGVFDTSDPGARNYTHTFTRKGTFNAVLEVLNDKNQAATATIPISVTGSSPVATARVNPSNGAAPLTVNFTGSGTDRDGTIAKFEWDFQGDGTFDFTSPTTGNTTFTYSAAGTFNAIFRVTDNDGLNATARVTATAIRIGPPGSPTATITSPASPSTGNAPHTVSFNGTGSDPDGRITKYEWDFNGDGVYDFSSLTPASTSFKYEAPGTFTAALRVTDTAGLTGVDTIDITVNALVTLAVSTDTCRPLQGGTVSVNTTQNGTTPITIFIRNRAGQTVRTLVNNLTRVAGSYADAWDCKDASGQIVPENFYYAILQYTLNGQRQTLDLSRTTSIEPTNPPWVMSTTSRTSACTNCPFKPFEDDFLKVDFTLARASEVTVSVRLFNRLEEVAPLLSRKLFGRGTYTLFWEGADVTGRIVAPPPGEQFIWGMTALTLPNNAIFVESAPQVSDVSAEPNYFDPATGNFAGTQSPTTKISYTLSKQANVSLQVYRTGTNTLVRTVNQPNVAAGAQIIEWDGRSESGIFVDKGDYRLALKSTDAAGNQSIVRYVLVRVFY